MKTMYALMHKVSFEVKLRYNKDHQMLACWTKYLRDSLKFVWQNRAGIVPMESICGADANIYSEYFLLTSLKSVIMLESNV